MFAVIGRRYVLAGRLFGGRRINGCSWGRAVKPPSPSNAGADLLAG